MISAQPLSLTRLAPHVTCRAGLGRRLGFRLGYNRGNGCLGAYPPVDPESMVMVIGGHFRAGMITIGPDRARRLGKYSFCTLLALART